MGCKGGLPWPGQRHINGWRAFSPPRAMRLQAQSSLLSAIFMGFSSAMLGVSGFETSAQFVESMHSGTHTGAGLRARVQTSQFLRTYDRVSGCL